MQHYYNKIQGWFDYEAVYDNAISTAKDGALFVEVGAWKGKSAAYAGVEILNSGKKITLHVVDHFEGSEEHRTYNSPHFDVVTSKPGQLQKVCEDNLYSVKDAVKIVKGHSVSVAKSYKNKSLDLVFIDGSHDEASLIADIKAWLPKVKDGGVIAGHDYDFKQVKKVVLEFFPAAVDIIGKSWVHTVRSVENGKD